MPWFGLYSTKSLVNEVNLALARSRFSGKQISLPRQEYPSPSFG
jgi:hypothetical protein